jgi:hypothetical protein
VCFVVHPAEPSLPPTVALMRPDQQIQINSLLLDREALFVRIHDIEQAAAALLGAPYPFTRPALPSDAKPKRKPAAPRPTSPGDPLRRLEGLETAYRVTYRRFGQIVTEDHDDLDALRTLLSAQGANLTVTRLETIDLGGRTKAVLLDPKS